jgi:glycosyltransferase involved in cell wall biosynthesis
MPTVLQVLPRLHSGGVERGAVEITRALAGVGWKPLIASAGGELERSVRYAGGEHIALNLASKNPLTLWRNAGALEALVRERGVDIIHARSRAPAWSAWLAARRTGCRFVTTFHGVYNAQNALKKRYNSVMTRGERVIAVSQFVAEHIRTHYAIDPERVVTIPRGVDPDAFAPEKAVPKQMAELLRSWNLPDDGLPIILVPGRISRWKGQDVCLRALAALPHRNFQCVLLGSEAGHEAFGQELRELISALGLEGKARLVGSTHWMTEAYKLAAVVIAPSVEPEAFGRVAVEAQAVGRPVIATRHGGACETIIENETGLLVAPGSVEALAEAIAGVLSMPEDLRMQVERDAMRHVREHFTLDRMCERTLAVYKDVLG